MIKLLLNSSRALFGVFLCLSLFAPLPLKAELSDEKINRILVIDNFDHLEMTNLLGGATQGDEDMQGGCIPGFVEHERAFGHRGASLVLDYEVLEPGAFSYYWSKLGAAESVAGATTPCDLSSYRYLSFWIHSADEKPRFSVEFHQDVDGDHLYILSRDLSSKVIVDRFIQPGAIENGWRKVVIPLSRFRRIADWSNMLEMVIVFESSQGSGKGRLGIDDILVGSFFPEKGEREALALTFYQLKGSFGRYSDDETQRTFELNRTHPSLEGIVIAGMEERDHAAWRTLHTFYRHNESGRYEVPWATEAFSGTIHVRALAFNIWGEEIVLAED